MGRLVDLASERKGWLPTLHPKVHVKHLPEERAQPMHDIHAMPGLAFILVAMFL